jgi:hypothetical protein
VTVRGNAGFRTTGVAVAGTFLLSGCATTPQTLPLSALEKAAICAIVPDIDWAPFGNVAWEEDRDKIEHLERWATQFEFKPLPAAMRCADGRLRLHGKDPNVPFAQFWSAPDGRRAAITGGFFGGQLLGGGGTCYYEREAQSWRRVGCVNTWSI